MTIGNDIIIDVDPVENKSVLNSYRYDEEATNNEVSFIITDREYYDILDMYVMFSVDK